MDNVIVFCAKYVLVLVLIAALVAWLRAARSAKLRFAVTMVVAGIVALVLSRIASRLYYDPRPFVTEHIKPLIAHAADNGFPSDHALLTMTVTAVMFCFSKKWAYWALVFTVIVGVARVLAHVHSPLDIAAAWAIGIIAAAISYYLVRWVVAKRSNKTEPVS